MNLIHTASGRNVPRLQDFNAEISTFAVGTRKSKLALKQTELAVEALTAAWPDYQYDVKARDTAAGDIDKITPFRDMPVKNLWTHELEALLLEKKLDILIHSLKGKSMFVYRRENLTRLKMCLHNSRLGVRLEQY